MSDIIENLDVDKDTVSAEKLEKLFSTKCNLLAETTVTLKKTYINKLSINKSLHTAVSVVDNGIEVYQLNNSLSKICKLSGHKKNLTELVFSPMEEHLLYSAGHDGVKLWDLRASGTCVLNYSEESDAVSRQYECLDVSCSGRVLVGGSQLVGDDAFLVFWDVRAPQPLGGYWNSHRDDITQVKFHKERPEILASGSTDGLLNVYNILEPSEDEALLRSLNTCNSVECLRWIDPGRLACLTHTHTLQLWDAAGELTHEYQREGVARAIKRLRADDCYLVDAYASSDGSTVLLAGSYSEDGGVLRSLTACGSRLRPRADYSQNRQIVTCSAYDPQRDILLTAGEAGILSVWR